MVVINERTSLLLDSSQGFDLNNDDDDGSNKHHRTKVAQDIKYPKVSIDDLSHLYADKPEHMTAARRVSRFLSRFAWYHPLAWSSSTTAAAAASEASEAPASRLPNLDSAWAYLEHFVLPRHFVTPDDDGHLTQAEPGDQGETRLYNVWSTPERELAGMGIGVSIYFCSLRYLAVVLMLGGLINIPNLLYYQSADYKHDNDTNGLPALLQVSAICTDFTWAACPTCTRDQWDYFPRTFDRYAQTANGERKFIKVNTCNFGYFLGLFSWISNLVVVLGLYVVCFHIIKHMEVAYDEAKQTTADYSVSVENPPSTARDAQQWRAFFGQFGHVTCCTVAVDNEEMVRPLIARRKLLYALSQLLPPQIKFDKNNLQNMVDQAMPIVWWQKLMGLSSAEQLKEQIDKLDQQIFKLADDKPSVAEVFITFETEQAQRAALRQLSVSRWDTITKNTKALPEHLLFEGKHLLNVLEPPEPSAVRWQDLFDSLKRRLSIRLVTDSLTVLMIILGTIVITYCQIYYGPAIAALAISALNTLAPYVCYALTDLESHPSEDSKQASKYCKVTASLWVFTALVTAAVTPFTNTVTSSKDGILYSLYAIFIFELIRGPITQCADISGNVQRHLLGPRVTNRLQLAGLFQGTAYDLSERYTNMTNVLFLTFYYATIFPAGYFFAALTMIVHYWTDKFCLLRIWSPGPHIGTSLSEFCRRFIVATMLVLTVISSYYAAGFPFDNACEGSEKAPSEYIGDYTATDGEGKSVSVSISENDNTFHYCNMDMMRYRPPTFPAWSSNQPEGLEWMDRDQENISWFFGWTSVAAIVFGIAIFVNRAAIPFFRRLCFGLYEPRGAASLKGFSEVLEIFAYIPQVKVAGLAAPLLACNVNDIDRQLIGWDDPKNGVNWHNVIYDLPGLADKPGIFSEIYHWPPGSKN